MSSQLSTTQSVKQSTRQFMSVASDKMKLASATVVRGDTRVSSQGADAFFILCEALIPIQLCKFPRLH